jgi:hypothetical protein
MLILGGALSLGAQPLAYFLLDEAASHRFRIESASCLYIEGSSNVTDFRCECEQSFPVRTTQVIAESSHLRFSGATLTMPVTAIDCGQRAINRDMQETLLADEHPNIRIELLNAHLPGSDESAVANEGTTIWAQLRITLAGQSRDMRMRVFARQLSPETYRFAGSLDIQLSHFGLTPPSPMLGLIKVDDRMKISMDLVVSVE